LTIVHRRKCTNCKRAAEFTFQNALDSSCSGDYCLRLLERKEEFETGA
jgi:hypothetical protein